LNQIEGLKHEADMDVAPESNPAMVERTQIHSENPDFAMGRFFHRGDQVQ